MAGVRDRMKDSAEAEIFTTRRIAVVEEDVTAAEILHTFFRLMELEPSIVPADSDAAATICRLSAETVLLDADLPNLLAVEIARDVRLQLPAVLIIFTTARDSAAVPADELLIRKPQRFDDFLALLELVIERGSEGASELKIEN